MTDNLAIMQRQRDDLDLTIEELSRDDPELPDRLAAEVRRQRLIAAGVASRKVNRLTQAAVAERMGVSQSVVAEIESGRTDIRYSTLDRYMEVVTKGRKRIDLVPV
ncbi:MAG: helix-turn-helix transcriptional regulator [Chloroflexi bacterium]|nr:helix-turn-helix transcriptional regulator [Chloroflexota bacterium]